MNILYHHRTQGKGVEGIHIMGIVNAFRALYHSVFVLGPIGTNPRLVYRVSKSKNIKDSVFIWSFISKFTPEVVFEAFEVFYNLYSFVRLYIIMKQRSFDFIYERYALFHFGVLLAARLRKVPVILEVNDAAAIRRVRPLKFRKLACWFEKNIFQNAQGLVTISTYLKDYILSYGIDDYKVSIIPNAIDPENYASVRTPKLLVRKQHQFQDKLVVGFVGLFVSWNGILSFLDIFKKICDSYPDVHLLLVGDGPERQKIQTKIKELELMKRVTITGYVSHQSVPGYIRVFDIAIMPDSNEYRSPVKIFEYMAMGKPIIAPSYLPIKEILTQNKNALLFEPEDNEKLLLSLERLIKDPHLRSSLGRRAKQDVFEKHTWSQNADKILQLLHSTEQTESQHGLT